MGRSLERKKGIYSDQPELVFKGGELRKQYVRRWRWALVAMLASGGMFYMLSLQLVTDAVDALTWMPYTVRLIALNGGRIIAATVLLISVSRFLANVLIALRRKTQRMKFYDRGFTWEINGEKHKYGWNAVKTVREQPHSYHFAGRTLLQWGGVTFKMRDGNQFKFTPAHGNINQFLQRVHPYYTAEIGTRMGQMLRLNKTFKVHPAITVTPAGLVIDGKNNKTRIGWAQLHLELDNDKHNLSISRYDEYEIMQPVMKLSTYTIDNLGAFMEVAETTMENYQRPNPYK